MNLTSVGLAHAEALATIHGEAFPIVDRWSEAVFRDLLAAPGIGGLVSEAGGFVLWRRAADEADIVTLAVQPFARCQGLGRALLTSALHYLRTEGTTHVFLEVAEPNTAAMALYDNAGFSRVGLRRGYYRDGGNAVLMRRDLT